MCNWHTVSHLPNEEPNAHNHAAYQQAQLMAGASPDGQFIYDVVYAQHEQCFVLTLMHINTEWGFIEQQIRLYPSQREQLLQHIQQFQTDPQRSLNDFQAA